MNLFCKMLLFLPALAFYCCCTFSQGSEMERYPIIGKRCPEFTLYNVRYFPQSKISLKDFAGKWLILDFWTRYCPTCIKSFPETNQLAEIFKGRVQFILVGYEDNYIKPLYDKVKARYELQLPIAFDTALFSKFAIPSVPHVVWIDDKGLVRAITSNQELNVENVEAFLGGTNPTLPEKMNAVTKSLKLKAFDFKKPYLVNRNGGDDTGYLFRSVLTNWTPSFSIISYESDCFKTSPYKTNEVLVLGSPLFCLYEMAYGDTVPHRPLLFDPPRVNNYGKYWVRPLLRMKDTTDFAFDYSTGKNLFCYNLTVPHEKADIRYMQKIMQRDLQNYFGYKVQVENRHMPCWELVATNSARLQLKSKGGHTHIDGDGITGQTLINQPISVLISIIWGQNQDEPPIIDKTGIKNNIDISIDAILSDIKDVKKALRKHGLDLIMSKREMKTILIYDN
jgi:thiol-disulfide isomerase/thioredoxin